MNFKKFEKIARLGTKETEGILNGCCWVSAKLDGTNGSVWLAEGELQFGSRNRHLSVGEDNAGFLNANRGSLRLRDYFCEHPRHRVYGEWLVPHTIKGYQDDAWRRFYVYEVEDDGVSVSPDIWMPYMKKHEMDYIPHYAFTMPKMADIELLLLEVAKEFMKEGELGEGIVIKNFGFTNRYGDMRYAKYINEGFQSRPKKVATDNQVEADLANLCVSPGLVRKNADKIKVNTLWGGNPEDYKSADDIPWDRKTMIPKLMSSVYHDVMTEKLEAALEEMKMPTVNFKVFRGAVSRAIKDNGKEFF